MATRTRSSWCATFVCASTVISIFTWTTNGAAQKPKPKPTPAPAPAPKRFTGWTNKRAQDLAGEALEAKNGGDFAACVDKDRESLKLEDHPYVKHHLAGCLTRLDRWAEAYGYERETLVAAQREDDADLRRVATQRAAEIMEHVAAVRLRLPAGKSGKVRVLVDGRERTELRVLLDPGEHKVHAELVDRDERYFFDETITLAAKEEKTVEVLLQKSSMRESELRCLETADTLEKKQDCIIKKSATINVHAGVEISAYSDTTNVHVFSPSANASLSSPTAGWNVGGSYLVDIVSAASPDIVSQASRRFRETRHASTLGGSYKLGNFTPQVNGSVSSEPDYLSMTGAGSLAYEHDKFITPRLGYGFTRDRIGIRNTPFAQYERNLATHEIEAGVTIVMNRSTLVVLGASLQFQRGEQSKLYRFVPLFAPDVAKTIEPGESADDVNLKRLDARPREVVPNQRDRYAIGGRVNHRMGTGQGTATLRLEERLYTDSWGIKATTTDARYVYDLGSHLQISGHLRYHLQSGTSFYQLAYEGLVDDRGSTLTTRPYRTGDRELSPMMTATAGLGARIELGETGEGGTPRYAIVLGGDVMTSKFFRSLYVESRQAAYGSLGFEVDF